MLKRNCRRTPFIGPTLSFQTKRLKDAGKNKPTFTRVGAELIILTLRKITRTIYTYISKVNLAMLHLAPNLEKNTIKAATARQNSEIFGALI